MPTLCRFHGISIAVFWCEHPPPHFHALAGGVVERFRIDDLASLDSDPRRRLPAAVRRLVLEWVMAHRRELAENWNLAGRKQLPMPIGYP